MFYPVTIATEDTGAIKLVYRHIKVVAGSPPELLEASGVGRGVPDGVLDVAVSEVILNEPCIRALVGKGEAAGVAQHVRMGEQGE